MTCSRFLAAVTSGILAAGAAQPSPVAAAYAVNLSPTVLATLDGNPTQAQAMNRRGEVLGLGYDATMQVHAGVWQRYDTFTALPTDQGMATDINNLGHVIGAGTNQVGAGFLWRDGTLTHLVYPSAIVWPEAINDRDQIVGNIDFPDIPGSTQAFLWQDGVFTLLPTPSDMMSLAVDINDHGQVLGELVNRDWSVMRGTIWQNGTVTDLGTLGGTFTESQAINNRGQVIGRSAVSTSGDAHPFLWQHGTMIDLLAGTSAAYGQVSAINDAGVIVGEVGMRAVYWRNARMTVIGPEGYYSTAMVINQRGDIGGTLVPAPSWTEPDRRAFLWRSGHVTVLDAVDDVFDVTVVGLDDRGRLAGTISGFHSSHAVVWDPHSR